MLLAVVCAVMIPRVNINSDMTKYLPDGSSMKHGIDILKEEFGGTEISGADVRAMFEGLTDEQIQETADRLEEIPEIDGVTYRKNAEGDHVLYELMVSKSVDQKKLGKELQKDFGSGMIVETSQDGATPPLSVVIIAAVLIIVILVLMTKSWMDPVLFLLSTGTAIVLNIGTNALLPSVSITTNYIVAILQLVLSLDYSIVMMNRYRQERDKGEEPLEAVNTAVPRAASAVISSATTTVVGLLMLCFMRLKIGLDMGLVLAKGVVFSLICTFTVMPTLILMFNKAIEASVKKGFVIPTNRLARYSSRFKIPLAIGFVILFVASMLLHDRTEISFSTEAASEINQIFPKTNTTVIVYDNKDENSVMALGDSVKVLPGVQSFVSYPTILKKQYKAEDMSHGINSVINELGPNMPGMGVEIPDISLLTPEILRIAYYMKEAGDDDIRISFTQLTDFIIASIQDNPLVAGMIDEEMQEKLNLLAAMNDTDVEEEIIEEEPVTIKQPASPKAETTSTKPLESQPKKDEAPSEKIIVPVIHNTGNISIIDITGKLAADKQDFLTSEMASFSDTVRLRTKMSAEEMSKYIGSTPSQTKMVYSFSKSKSKKMTPLEYVHFLTDDLFNRRSLQSMVNATQKAGLIVRRKVMDYANADAKLSAAEIAALVTEYGEAGVTEEYIKNLAFPPALTASVTKDTPSEVKGDSTDAEKAAADTTGVHQAADSLFQSAPQPVAPPKPIVRRKTKEELQQEFFLKLMNSEDAFTAEEMTKNFDKLGQDIDPSLVKLLYTYYGSENNYNEDWTMSIEELVEFVSDVIMPDPVFTAFIDDNTRDMFAEAEAMFSEGLGKLVGPKHSIAVSMSSHLPESAETYEYIDNVNRFCDELFENDTHVIGESAMFSEMKHGFSREMTIVTWLTVLAIFLIVALTFQSLVVPTILVLTVMTGVFVNVVMSGVITGHMLYLAYLIVQSILMGATIDYGILFTNYYVEKRKTLDVDDAIKEAYKGSIHTIMTSGLIMVLAPGVMAIFVDDVTISAIVGSLAIGAGVSVFLILTVLPGLLAAFDRMVVYGWAGRKKLKDIREERNR